MNRLLALTVIIIMFLLSLGANFSFAQISQIEHEIRFIIMNGGVGLSGTDVTIYSDPDDYPAAYGTTGEDGLMCLYGDNCSFKLQNGGYTLFIVSREHSTAIVKKINVGTDGDLLVDITNEWASTVQLTVNANKIDSTNPLDGSLNISISSAWPETIGSFYGTGVFHVTPYTYYYLGVWNYSDGYYLYDSDITVPMSGHSIDFYPTSSSVSKLQIIHNFDSCYITPSLENPDVWTAPRLEENLWILTPGIYSINYELTKEHWRYRFKLMENFTFLSGELIQATVGGGFFIETFEAEYSHGFPGHWIYFDFKIEDLYGHQLTSASLSSGKAMYPRLVVKDPYNRIVHDDSAFFSWAEIELDSDAIEGRYTATLTFDTGIHQGEISKTTYFQVGTSLPCEGDLDGDNDVDGSDIVMLINNSTLIDIALFTQSFGTAGCPEL